MIIRNASLPLIDAALVNANSNFDNNIIFKRIEKEGRGFRLTLRVKNSRGKGAKLGFDGKRHTVAACFHAHKAFLKELYDLAPGAKTISSQAIFEGKTQFDANAHFVGQKNIGSVMRPLEYGQACNCENY